MGINLFHVMVERWKQRRVVAVHVRHVATDHDGQDNNNPDRTTLDEDDDDDEAGRAQARAQAHDAAHQAAEELAENL